MFTNRQRGAFKKALRTTFFSGVLCVLAVSLASCNLPMNEEPPVQRSPDNKFGAQTQCLESAYDVMSEFLDGAATPERVSGIWDCFGNAISLFQKSTRGRYEDRFTARELANFFERYYLKDVKISNALLTEIFRLKQLFVGGGIDHITRAEMTNLVRLAARLRGMSLELLPYMRVFTMNWKVQGVAGLEQDVRYFEAANLTIQKAAKDLGAIISENGNEYDMAHVVVLLEEFARLYNQNPSYLSSVRQAMPLVYKIKKTLTGGNEQVVAPSEWRRFGLLAARGYVQFLRYKYFLSDEEASANGGQIVYLARSIDDLFSYLGDMVAEKPAGVFTRAELLEVLQAVALMFPEVKISDPLLKEFMKVKQLFFGGSDDNFTPDDFIRARSKVEDFRYLTERFLAYVDVYTLAWQSSSFSYAYAQSYFQMAEGHLQDIGKKLGQIAETNYNLQDLVSLADQIDQLYPPAVGERGRPLKTIVQEYLPLIIAGKRIIFGQQGPMVYANQWSDLLEIVASAYSRFMYYHYFLKGSDMLRGSGLNSFGNLTKQSLNLLDVIISRKPSNREQAISFDEINDVIQALDDAKILPKNITTKTLQELTETILSRVLVRPERRLSGEAPPQGLTKEATHFVREEFSIWLENQRLLDTLFVSPEAEREGRSAQALLADLQKFTQTPGVKEFQLLLSGPSPSPFDEEHRLVLAKPWKPYTRSSMNAINITRALSRLVIRSYSSTLEGVQSYRGITEEEALLLFTDVRKLVVEMGILDEGNEDFHSSRFIEANLFVPSSVYDSYLSFQEGTELFLYLVSGIKIDTMVMEKVEKVCPVQMAPFHKDWRISVDCLQKAYRAQVSTGYASLPDFTKFLMAFDERQFNQTFANLMLAANADEPVNGTVRMQDVSLIPHVSQYIEFLLQTYNENDDMFLDTRESLLAFARFKTFLTKFVKADLPDFMVTESMVKAVFTYILVKGKKPKTTGDYISFVGWWLKGEKNWNVHADREKLISTLGLIVTETRNSKKGPFLDMKKLKEAEATVKAALKQAGTMNGVMQGLASP